MADLCWSANVLSVASQRVNLSKIGETRRPVWEGRRSIVWCTQFSFSWRSSSPERTQRGSISWPAGSVQNGQIGLRQKANHWKMLLINIWIKHFILSDTFTSDLSKKISLTGGAVDIHKAIGKLSRPARGWTLSGHKYSGTYNDLAVQRSLFAGEVWSGQTLEIYDQPTGATDAISMQHDFDYSVCGDDRKCKNEADRRMVAALDRVPKKFASGALVSAKYDWCKAECRSREKKRVRPSRMKRIGSND